MSLFGPSSVRYVQAVPWWGLVPSAAAPVLLVGGSMVAAQLQPRSYDPMGETVSGLAALGAADRWVMTLAFAVAAACELATGLVLRPARLPGRLILIAAAVAGILVAASPEHLGGSLRHGVFAAVSLGALTLWPAAAWRVGPMVPWALRPGVTAWTVVVLLVLLAWFGLELITGAGHAGLAERLLGLAQSSWPFVVIMSCRRTGTRPALAAEPASKVIAHGGCRSCARQGVRGQA